MFCTLALVLSAVCVCNAQYGCFDVVLSRYDAQVLSEWYLDGSSCPYVTGITFHEIFSDRQQRQDVKVFRRFDN